MRMKNNEDNLLIASVVTKVKKIYGIERKFNMKMKL